MRRNAQTDAASSQGPEHLKQHVHGSWIPKPTRGSPNCKRPWSEEHRRFARPVGLDTRGQVSRDGPSRCGSFLTISSTQQPRRITWGLMLLAWSKLQRLLGTGQRDRHREGSKASRGHRTCPIHGCQLFPNVLPTAYVETEAGKNRSVLSIVEGYVSDIALWLAWDR